MPYAPLIDADDVQEAGEYMRHYTHPFITPITMDLDEDELQGRGRVLGSATFLELRGKPYILTNEHVARLRRLTRLRYVRDGGQEAPPILHPFHAEDDPVDAALARIDEAEFATSGKQMLPASALARTFDAVEGEIFFILGYPGVKARWSALFDGVMANTWPYATDRIDPPPGFDPDLHFALSLPDDVWMTGHVGPVIRPNPKGLSGSVVWDTRYVAAGANQWFQTDASVCGLVTSYSDTHQCLIATRIEAVRRFILQALREEAAYFHWLNDRNMPLWDAQPDWDWAEGQISDVE